jgi:choline kinase
LSHIKDCLIVAAGKGTRLKQFGDIKPLVELCGTSLIEQAMDVAVEAGVEKFVVVTGYQTLLVEDHLENIRQRRGWTIVSVYNAAFEQANGLSVLKGEPHLPGEFYLAMCDHLVDSSIYEHLAHAKLPENSIALAVDYRLSNPDVDIDDVTKVRTRDHKIIGIGKELEDYNSFDTGIFRANASLFAAIRKSQMETGDCSISGGMKILGHDDMAFAIDVGTSRWIDIDSPEMLNRAQNWRQEVIVNSGYVLAEPL